MIIIPVKISEEILLSLNVSENELQDSFQQGIAVMLFKQGKLTIGKAIELSGLSRYGFEKLLFKNDIPLVETSLDEVLSDVEKMKDL